MENSTALNNDSDPAFLWNTTLLPTIVSAGLFVCPGSGIHQERIIDSYEFIYVRQGVLGMVESGRELIARQGMSLVLLPGRTHRGLLPYGADLSFYWVHFLFPGASGLTVETPGGSPTKPSANRTIGVPQLASLPHPEQAIAQCDRLLHARGGGNAGGNGIEDDVEASLVLSLLLLEAARAGSRTEDPPHARAVVRRIDEYIAAHIRKPLSTRDIARALGYNPDYLSRVYRMGSGRTLTEGIHARRIADARIALTQTTQTVDQIAYACGYADPSYFRRMFHRLAGSTPQAFRDMYYRVKINTR